MKISYRTHPVLEKIHSRKLGPIMTTKEDYSWIEANRELLRVLWGHNCNSFYSKKIQYVTEPFIDAMYLAHEKISTPELRSAVLLGSSGGTIITKYETLCYYIEPTKNGNPSFTIFEFLITEEGKLLLAGVCSYVVNESDTPFMFASNNRQYPNGKWNHFMEILDNLVMQINFLKYANIEIDILKPKERKRVVNCKYVNETPCEIQILNSTWFTTLVKSDAFKVRGHFRLQPKKKDGKWTKEIIWINDFVKEGYTATARKLSHT